MARAELTSMKSAPKAGTRRGAHHTSHSARRRPAGLAVEPVFCPTDVADPFDTVEWDQRTAAIKGESGEVLFEQTNCEIPKTWSQLATNVVCSKYFYGEVDTPQREN